MIRNLAFVYTGLVLLLFLESCIKKEEKTNLVFTHQYSNSYMQVYPKPDELFYSRIERYFDPADSNNIGVDILFHNTFIEPGPLLYKIGEEKLQALENSRVRILFKRNVKEVVTKELRIMPVKSVNNKEYFLNISYDPRVIYEASGKMENIDDAFIVHQTNIFYVPCPADSFYEYFPTPEEKEKVYKELGSFKLTGTKTEQSQKIAIFLLDKLSDHKGIPSDSMEKSNPFQKYKRAICGTDKVWCSNIAEIFTYFCSCYDIPARNIGLGFSFDNKSNPLLLNSEGHTNTEVYDNKTKKWTLIDLTFNMIGVEYKKDVVLNTLDFYYLLNNPELNNSLYMKYYDEKKKTIRTIRVKDSPVYNSLLNYYKLNTKFFYPCKGALLPL